MGQTSDPETLVIHQKLTPDDNPKNFKQHYDHGGSLQLHIHSSLFSDKVFVSDHDWNMVV
jgi:hypothetical protein